MPLPAIVLIESQSTETTAIGSGFIVHHDSTYSYIVTCAHVVRDVGGPERVKAAAQPAVVVALGETNGLDLAVLRVERLMDRPILSLRQAVTEGLAIKIDGYSRYIDYRPLGTLNATLDTSFYLSDNQQRHFVTAWYMSITGSNKLEGGYSGAPVSDMHTNEVIGVAITRDGDQKGRAISLAALPIIWPDMPPDLIKTEASIPPVEPISVPEQPLQRAEPQKPASDPSDNSALLQSIREQASHLQDLIEALKRRLQAREIQHAKFGINTDPSILIEIEDLKQEIAERSGQQAIKIYLAAYPKAIASARSEEYLIDWTAFFQQGDPAPAIWNQQLFPELERHQMVLANLQLRQIHLRAYARNSVGLAFGYVFRKTSGFTIQYSDNHGVLWQTNATALSRSPLTRSDQLIQQQGTDLVIEVAITQGQQRVQQPVDHWIARQKPALRKRILLTFATGTGTITPADGLAIAEQIRAIINEERVSGGTTHLFGAIPLGLALQIGWQLNSSGKIQGYELDGNEQYQPACLLR